jgi:hypothetical protein
MSKPEQGLTKYIYLLTDTPLSEEIEKMNFTKKFLMVENLSTPKIRKIVGAVFEI